MSIINLGYTIPDKEQIIADYIKEHEDISHVIVIYPDKWETVDVQPEREISCEIEMPKGLDAAKTATAKKDQAYEGYVKNGVLYLTYSETIMYRTFYPLLQKIDDSYLIVLDECMRDTKRGNLYYNCIHKYLNQTHHKLIFQYLPFIKETKDFMILLDFVDEGKYKSHSFQEGKYKGKDFDYSLLSDVDISYIDRCVTFSKIKSEITDDQRAAYEDKKNELFDDLRKKDPDTVPAELELFIRKFKKTEAGKTYVARTKGKKGVVSFTSAEKADKYTLLDLPLERKKFTDFLYKTGVRELSFVSTELPIDEFLYSEYTGYVELLKEFYSHVG